MTRNIISHDSRRRGNTKYYPAEAPVGWPAGPTTPAARWLYFAPGSSPQDMQRSRNAVINWLSRVTTPRCDRKKRACERASVSRTRSRSFRCNSRSSDPNFGSPRNGTALFALVICAEGEEGGCDLSSVFSKPSPGHRAPNESFVSFYYSALRLVSYYICCITAISVLQKLDTLLARLAAVSELRFKPSFVELRLQIFLFLSSHPPPPPGKNSNQMITR